MTTVLFLFLLFAAYIAGWYVGSRRPHRPSASQNAADAAGADEQEELIAVLAAAASEMLAAPVVVKRIQFLGDSSSGTWAATGRLNIMASHQISKRNT